MLWASFCYYLIESGPPFGLREKVYSALNLVSYKKSELFWLNLVKEENKQYGGFIMATRFGASTQAARTRAQMKLYVGLILAVNVVLFLIVIMIVGIKTTIQSQ